MKKTVSFGYEEVAPEEKTARVRGVFSNVASNYDLMNDAMSGGMHRLWKDKFVRRVKPQPGEDILDMAGGTGDIAFRMEKSGANITVSDINPDMLAVGMERAVDRVLRLAGGQRADRVDRAPVDGRAAEGAGGGVGETGGRRCAPRTPHPTLSPREGRGRWRWRRFSLAPLGERVG